MGATIFIPQMGIPDCLNAKLSKVCYENEALEIARNVPH